MTQAGPPRDVGILVSVLLFVYHTISIIYFVEKCFNGVGFEGKCAYNCDREFSSVSRSHFVLDINARGSQIALLMPDWSIKTDNTDHMRRLMVVCPVAGCWPS